MNLAHFPLENLYTRKAQTRITPNMMEMKENVFWRMIQSAHSMRTPVSERRQKYVNWGKIEYEDAKNMVCDRKVRTPSCHVLILQFSIFHSSIPAFIKHSPIFSSFQTKCFPLLFYIFVNNVNLKKFGSALERANFTFDLPVKSSAAWIIQTEFVLTLLKTSYVCTEK